MTKKKVAVILGGQSSEHDVSCVSGTTVIDHIDKELYEVVIIGITKEGHWLKIDKVEDVTSGEWRNGKVTAILSPDTRHQGVLFIEGDRVQNVFVDVIFPVLHGLYGEDGTVQGLIELSGVPYVGCGVLASSVSMDKLSTKIIVNKLHIRQARYEAVMGEELKNSESVLNRMEAALSYPMFVKPSRAGSSQGVSKADNKEELVKALFLAAKHDQRILVEETIVGREIECAVLGSKQPQASVLGEVLAAAEFYDYDAKYNNSESKTVIDPELPVEVKAKVQEAAVQIFKAVDGFGLSRVDFFVESGTNQLVFNEINTLPGFTPISMYPMLWDAMGISKKQLCSQLIEMAIER